jgi:hypothetical protein
MALRKKYTILWTAWIAGFLVIEGVAVKSPASGDTLSEHVWALLNLPAVSFAGLGFLAWIGWHFWRKASWK